MRLLALLAFAAVPLSSGLAVTAQTAVDRQPGNPGYGFGSVWVPSSQSGVVDRVDPRTMRVQARIHSGHAVAAPPNTYFDSIAVSSNAVWHASDAGDLVARIDPRTNKVVKRIDVPGRPGEIAAGPAGVYVSLFNQGTVLRIDPKRNRIARQVDVRAPAMGIAYGAGRVWVVTTTGPTVLSLDPVTLAVRSRTSIRSDAPVGPGFFSAWWIGADAHGVCTANQQQNVVTRLDTSGKVVAQTPLGFGTAPFSVAADGDTCWSANLGGVFAVGTDVASTTLPSPRGSFVGVAAGGGAAWVTIAGRNALLKVERR